MTNKTRAYNTGKAVTRNELNDLIKAAEDSNDWSKVEQANVSKITDMSYLFDGVKGIKDLNLDGWDTSNVVNMNGIFYGTNYNQPLYFDTSKVTGMDSMFSDSKYNHPLHFDTSNVKRMGFMFYNSVYNHPLHFNTSNVTDMQSMFYNSKYNHPLHLDTSNVTDMYEMFYKSKYNHPLEFATSNVKKMGGMFYNASITSPITFNGGNIPDDVQSFVDENNIIYEEKCELEGVVRDGCHDSNVVASSFKL